MHNFFWSLSLLLHNLVCDLCLHTPFFFVLVIVIAPSLNVRYSLLSFKSTLFSSKFKCNCYCPSRAAMAVALHAPLSVFCFPIEKFVSSLSLCLSVISVPLSQPQAAERPWLWPCVLLSVFCFPIEKCLSVFSVSLSCGWREEEDESDMWTASFCSVRLLVIHWVQASLQKTALGTRLQSFSGARERVAGAGAFLRRVSNKTQVHM